MSDSEQRRFDHQPSEGLADSSSLRPDPLLQALHDVPMPAGLERRLRESLALPGSPPLDANDALHGDADQQALVTSSARKPRRLSRRMWLSGTLAAGCGGVLLGNYSWLRRPLLEHAVINEALLWLPQLDPGHGSWHDAFDINGIPVDGIPMPPELTRQPRKSRQLKTEFASRTVAYELNFNGERCYLLAIKNWRDLSALPAAPPASPPMGQTGPWIVAAWQKPGCLYVIVLPKSAKHLYHKFLFVPPSRLV